MGMGQHPSSHHLPPPEKVPALNTPGEKGWGTWRLSTGPPSPRGFSSSFLCQSHQAGEPVLPETPLGAAVPRARRLHMAFARWGGASWEQDLSWGHGETLVRPGCLRSSSALLHLSPKTRGGGRLLCWPPRQSAHLGCSAATARLCCQVGLSLSTALQTSVTSLQDALQCTACLHWLSLGTKIEKEQFAFRSPAPRELRKRPATPKSAVRQGHHVQVAGVSQDGCGERARHSAVPPALAESRAGDNGGSPGQLAAGGGAQQGAVPAEMPGSLSLGHRAAARGRHQLGIR